MAHGREHLPAWLPPGAAQRVADAAGAVLARRGRPEEAKAAARAAAVACLPALPAPMLAEAVLATFPAEAPPPEHVLPSVAAADAGRLTHRLAVLAGGTNLLLGEAAEGLAARLAAAGAARIGDGE